MNLEPNEFLRIFYDLFDGSIKFQIIDYPGGMYGVSQGTYAKDIPSGFNVQLVETMSDAMQTNLNELKERRTK